jgi:translocation and assembly module TamA
LGRHRFLVAASIAGALIAAGPGAWAATPQRAEVRGVTDRALKALIQQVIGQAPAPTSRLEARRRANDAGEQVTAVLRSEGYYDAVVAPDIGDGDSPQPFVTVTLGPRTKIADLKIDYSGTAPDAASAQAAQTAMALKPGAPARASDVVAAEGRIVAALQQRGYADAAAEPRQVVVDHADNSMHPDFHIDSGAKVQLGAVVLEGKVRTQLAWVSRLAPWRRGAIYRPKDVAELERRLTETGAFNQVAVSLAPPDQAVDGLRPVVVTLTDRPKGTLELGASYSTTEGVGVDSRWIVYNRLGRADTITTSLQFAQIDSRLQTELALPDWGRPDQTLKLTGAMYRDVTPAYDLTGAGVSTDVTHRYSKTTYITYGVSFDETLTHENEQSNYISLSPNRQLSTFAALAGFALDKSNDPLNPTQGFRFSGQLDPTAAVGQGSIAYVKMFGQASAYLPLGVSGGTVIATRLKIGFIAGGSIPLVPPQDRFYGGGGGSVRGYGYQDVGPRYPDNTPEGGLSTVETSLEVRQRITDKWGLAAFVDTGSVGKQATPDISHPEIGVGLGVRYNLGFGPIRFDIGTPLVRRDGDSIIQVYLSIGQSF